MELFKKKSQPLLKSEAAAASDTEVNEIDAGVEFDTAIDELMKAHGKKKPNAEHEENESDEQENEEEGKLPFKKKGAESAADEGNEEDDDTEEEETVSGEPETEENTAEPKRKVAKKDGMKKSFADEVAEASEEAAAAIDVEPFLKALADKVGERLERMESVIAGIASTQESQSKVLIAESRMIKSLVGSATEQLSEVEPPKSVQTIERFAKSDATGAEGKPLTVQQAKDKLMVLIKSNRITPSQVSVVESRLNKNLALPEFFTNLIKEV